MTHFTRWMGAACLVAAFAATARADPHTYVRVSDNWGNFSNQQSGSSLVTAASGHDFGTEVFQGVASAAPGTLSIGVQGLVDTYGYAYYIDTSWFSEASFYLDDLIIAGSGPTVPVSLNLDLVGALAALGTSTGPGYGQVWSRFELEVQLYGGGYGTTWRFSYEIDDKSWEDPFGLPTLASFDGIITTSVVELPVGQPLTLLVKAKATVSFNASLPGSVFDPIHEITEVLLDASANFVNTIAFPSFGPVFNLADGHTVSSPSGSIEDNRWLGGSAPIPEPVSCVLLAPALGYLVWRRRRRKAT